MSTRLETKGPESFMSQMEAIIQKKYVIPIIFIYACSFLIGFLIFTSPHKNSLGQIRKKER